MTDVWSPSALVTNPHDSMLGSRAHARSSRASCDRPSGRVPQDNVHSQIALVLAGGGARAAYQIGVLNALARIWREHDAPHANPFPIITGTSAGAINAAALASDADHFDAGVSRLDDVWRHFNAEQVYRADAIGVIRSGAHWLTMLTAGWALARSRRHNVRSLLDNRPLADLLQHALRIDRIRDVMCAGQLEELPSRPPVNDYPSVAQIAGHALSSMIVDSLALDLERLQRVDIGTRTEWFGDGSMHEMAPIAPAIHLGADRVPVIASARIKRGSRLAR